MNKNFKRGIAFSLALMLVVLSGCGKKNNDAANGIDMSKEEVINELTLPITNEDISLSIYVGGRPLYCKEDVHEFKSLGEIEKITGIKLEAKYSGGGAGEQLNTMIASGDVPELIYTGWQDQYSEQFADGTFLPLNDYIDKWMPNLRRRFEENPELKSYYYGVDPNHIAKAFPTLPANGYYFLFWDGCFIRQDMLRKVGKEIPKTIEEWEDVLTAFKEIGLEAPFSTIKGMNTYVFTGAFDIVNSGYFRDIKTNKLTHAVLQPGYKEYLKTMNRWYKKGLMNSNYINTDIQELDSLVLNDKCGAFYIDSNKDMLKYMQMKPELDLAAVPYLKSSDGKAYFPDPSSSSKVVRTGGTIVTNKCKHIKEAVQFFDFLYSEQGANLMNWGFEGESYTVDANGNKKFTDQILKHPSGKPPYEALAEYWPNYGLFGGISDSEASKGMEDNFEPKLKKVRQDAVNYTAETDRSKNVPYYPLTQEEKDEISTLSEDLDTYIGETFFKFIIGTESFDNFDRFVEKCKSMGIEKIIEARQKALDRIK